MTELRFADCWYWFLAAAVCCYLIGCFNFAVLISKIKKSDIRSVGSGNPGTMNMSRTFGLKVGVVNFLCDAAKGGIPVAAAYFLFRGYVFAGTEIAVSDFARYFFGLFVVVGHIFPVTLKFKGGKGIASTLGLFWAGLSCEVWWFFFVGLGLLAFVFFYIVVFEWGSMGSLLGVALFTIWQAVVFVLRYGPNAGGWLVACLMILLLIDILTWAAHHRNIYKLLAGEEHRTSVKKMVKKKKSARPQSAAER